MANKKEPTLLEKAMMASNGPNRRSHNITDEEVDLVIAWTNGDISTRQYCEAMGTTTNNIGAPAALLGRCIRNGLINKVTRNDK